MFVHHPRWHQFGGGSTINKPAPAGQLTVARAKQVTIAGWVRPKKVKQP